MIPRYQRVLFWILSCAVLTMGIFLLHGCEQAREKLTRQRDQTPLSAPTATPSESVRLALANDSDGSITMVERDLSLPADPTARARTLLARLFAEYSFKTSNHPIQSGPAIDDVFLLDLPLRPPVSASPKPGMPTQAASSASSGVANDELPSNSGPTSQPHVPGGQLAVINLDGTFANRHPSGIEAETLTINSILGTLYANFPRIEQVRFLVDGRPRDTLAGHADLTRTYSVSNTETRSQETR